MIQKFNQYNESIKDQMKGKSKEDVDEAIKKIISKVTSKNTFVDIIDALHNQFDYWNREDLIEEVMRYLPVEQLRVMVSDAIKQIVIDDEY